MRERSGYFLLEALLSIVIFSVLLLSIFSLISFLQRRTVRSTFESDAGLLLQDGMEIAHSALLSAWTSYPDATYYPVFDSDSNAWVLVEGEETELEAKFNRKIDLKKVCRDVSTGDRLEFDSVCPGIIDVNTRQIVTKVTWMEEGIPKEVESGLLVLNVSK